MPLFLHAKTTAPTQSCSFATQSQRVVCTLTRIGPWPLQVVVMKLSDFISYEVRHLHFLANCTHSQKSDSPEVGLPLEYSP